MTVGAFARDYEQALRRQLERDDEEDLLAAYVLGRRALSDGLGVLELAHVHHQAVAAVLLGGGDPTVLLDRAARFLAECLAPFEMTLRGVEAANTELKAAHDKLSAEIDERRRIEESLWQSQKLQAVGRLAGGVAHHFNNLLTVVLGNLDIAMRQLRDNEAVVRRLDSAITASQRAAKVTRQLLSFSRRQLLKPEIFTPSDRLPEMIALIGGSLGNDVSIESDVPADLWPVRVDAAELELALLNLAINARDAMPGGGRLRITAANRSLRDQRLDLNGDYLAVEVSDTGTGIPPEVMARVFDPFFTTKDVGVGTGLGLSQVHGFVHQSHGEVDLESRPGAGTTVRLYLPAERPGADEAPVGGDRRPGGTILVVEDDVDVAEIAASVLQSIGFDVKLAYRAQIALDLLRRGEKVDLVFSDVVMPDGMSGVQLAQEIKRDYPELPVILATGYADAMSGATDLGLKVLSKPYRSAELADLVSGVLAER